MEHISDVIPNHEIIELFVLIVTSGGRRRAWLSSDWTLVPVSEMCKFHLSVGHMTGKLRKKCDDKLRNTHMKQDISNL